MQYSRQNFNYIGDVNQADHISLVQGHSIQQKCHNEILEEKIRSREGMESMEGNVSCLEREKSLISEAIERKEHESGITRVPGFRNPWSVTDKRRNCNGEEKLTRRYVKIPESNTIEEKASNSLEQQFTEELNTYTTLLEEYYREYQSNIGNERDYTDIVYSRGHKRNNSIENQTYVNKFNTIMYTRRKFNSSKCGTPENQRFIDYQWGAHHTTLVEHIKAQEGDDITDLPSKYVNSNYPCFLEGKNVKNSITGDIGYVDKNGILYKWEGNNTSNSSGTCPVVAPSLVTPSEWNAFTKSNKIMNEESLCDSLHIIDPALVKRIEDSNRRLVSLASQMNKATNKIYDILGEIANDKENARQKMKSNLEEFKKIYNSFDISEHKKKITTLKARANDEMMLRDSNNIGYTLFLAGALAVGIGAIKVIRG
jgi:hypothetical protein